MKKTDCPYCGKKEVTHRHIEACKPGTVELVNPVTEQPVNPATEVPKQVAPILDGTNYETCQKCTRQTAKRLDHMNWMCPVCGTYDALKRR